MREGRRELERERETPRRQVPNDRAERFFEAVRRLEQNEAVEVAAHRAYERWPRDARDTKGRRLGGPIVAFQAQVLPDGQINLTDPGSRVMRTKSSPPHQPYNCQGAVNERQIILAAEITIDPPDFGHLEKMLDQYVGTLNRACDRVTRPAS